VVKRGLWKTIVKVETDWEKKSDNFSISKPQQV